MRKLLLVVITLFVLGCAIPAKHNPNIAAIEIDGDKWIAVENLKNSSAHDKHYVLRRDADGSSVIVFGDGINGARLPTGTSHIKVTYRQGAGRYSGVRQQQGRVDSGDCR